MKTCSKCNQELPATLENFRSSRNKLRNDCRSCEYKNKVEYYKKRPGKQESENKKYYIENKEHLNKKARNYKKNNKGIVNLLNNRRRAKAKNNGWSVYTEEQVLETYGTNCNICNIPVDLKAARKVGLPGWENGLHIDHLLPVSKGGPDTLENVRPTHGLCNITKHNKENYEIKTA
jgi:hypothetical protein